MLRSASRSLSVVAASILIVGAALAPPTSADEPRADAEAAKKVEETARRKDAALKSAEKYLVLIDRGKFGESWDISSEGFQRLFTRPTWVRGLNKTRAPFGRTRVRKLNRVEMRATGGPDQLDQAWIYTDLRLMTGETTSELVIVSLDRGKDWRPSGYCIGDPGTFLKPPPRPTPPKPPEN